MDRLEKKQFVEQMNEKAGNLSILLVIGYQGLSVSKMEDLRGKVREAGATIQVAKNRLMKIALEDTEYSQISNLFNGPTAIAYSEDDPVGVAKAVVDFAKDNKKLAILGGGFGEKQLSEEEIKSLAKMPSLDDLRAKIIGLVNAPATKLATVLQAPAQKVVGVTTAYSKKES